MRWLRWVFALYLAGVLVLTLWPRLGDTRVPGWATAVVGTLAAVGIDVDVPFLEAASNAVLFIPCGVLGVILVASARGVERVRTVVLAVVVASSALSACIEVVQHMIPGRVPTLQDWVLNSAGAFAGALAAAGVRAMVRAMARAKRRRVAPTR